MAAKTHTDGEGGPVMRSEFLEVHSRDDDVDFVGHPMGTGCVGAE